MLRYKIYYDNKELPGIEPVDLDPFKNKSEDEIARKVSNSLKEKLHEIIQ